MNKMLFGVIALLGIATVRMASGIECEGQDYVCDSVDSFGPSSFSCTYDSMSDTCCQKTTHLVYCHNGSVSSEVLATQFIRRGCNASGHCTT